MFGVSSKYNDFCFNSSRKKPSKSEYDQEMLQLLNTDHLMAPRGRVKDDNSDMSIRTQQN